MSLSPVFGPYGRVQPVTPPLKGSFPLDYEKECHLEMLKYMCCLKVIKTRFIPSRNLRWNIPGKCQRKQQMSGQSKGLFQMPNGQRFDEQRGMG